MHSLIQLDTLNQNDTVVQISRCSFDAHIHDTLGTLSIGATVVLLRPRGSIDFDYLVQTMKSKQITYILTVPSLLHSYFTFLEQISHLNSIECLRSVCTGGM